MCDDEATLFDAMRVGDLDALRSAASRVAAFPHGECSGGEAWILHAASFGTVSTLRWMIGERVNLAVNNGAGFHVLHTVIESDREDQAEALEVLIEGGAPLNVHGWNDWTPLHMAAAYDNWRLIRLLLKHGADPTIRTRIDECNTPIEEARMLGMRHAVRELEMEEPWERGWSS